MITISRERRLKNMKNFNEVKLNLLNIHLDLKLEELQSTIDDIVNIKSKIYEIEKKCDY